MFQRILWASLALTPVALALHYAAHAGDVVVFAMSAAALIPLAWLIGEATEQLAEHTGHGVGGFLNATFGNAPELIIALIAVQQGLFTVVRGSITGSVVSNLLLVFGLTLIASKGGEKLDTRSLVPQLATIAFAVALFLIPSIAHWNGGGSFYRLTVPVACVLFLVYLVSSFRGLRRHGAMHREEATEGAWPMSRSIIVLAVAATATAFVSEGLVGSLEGFGEALGWNDFFIAVVIVAIVGNAAEHGGAIVVARRGKTKLASEIAISSSAQVAVLVASAVALLSATTSHHLPLSFRPVELVTMAVATLVVAAVVIDGRSTKLEGWLLVGGYGAAVAAYALFP